MNPILASLHLPPALSNHAASYDELFHFIGVIYIVFQVIITVGSLLFFVMFRKKAGEKRRLTPSFTHSTALEITWTVIPTILVFVIFWWGFVGFMRLWVAPRGAYEIRVNAQQWSWSFEYPEGFSSSELVIPANEPVKLIMSSKDVIHSLYIPDFRVKMDVVPHRFTSLWFTALQVVPQKSTAELEPFFVRMEQEALEKHKTYVRPSPEQYTDSVPVEELYKHLDLFCAEYCGKQHSVMYAKVIVLDEGEFGKWRDKNSMGGSPAEMGAKLYKSQGCVSCHTTNGDRLVGPSFKHIWGESVKVLDKATNQNIERVVDENYVRQSVLEPSSQIVDGYPDGMTRFQLNDDQIYNLTEFIRSLGEHYVAPDPDAEGAVAPASSTEVPAVDGAVPAAAPAPEAAPVPAATH